MLCFVSGLVVGQTCENCQIIRGDANCDGVVNMTDAINIINGVYANADAADANDDGAVDISDGIYLLNYLNLGTAAPPCPFPGEGRDCTNDALETCCSPPVGSVARQYTATPQGFMDEAIGGIDEWQSITSINGSGGWPHQRIRFFNEHGCVGAGFSTANNVYDIRWGVTSAHSFTKNRLKHNIQNLSLTMTISESATKGAACFDYLCVGVNSLVQDSAGPKYTIGIGPVAAGMATTAINSPFSLTTFSHNYQRVNNPTGGCKLQNLNTPNAIHIIATVDLDSLIEPYISSDCEEWKIYTLEVDDIRGYFIVPDGNEEIAAWERLDVTVAPKITETWCVCP